MGYLYVQGKQLNTLMLSRACGGMRFPGDGRARVQGVVVVRVGISGAVTYRYISYMGRPDILVQDGASESLRKQPIL